MGISDLPLELMYQIADYLEFERDINALVRINKRSYNALNSYLYRHHVKVWDALAFEAVCYFEYSNSIRTFVNEGMSLDPCRYGWSFIAIAAMYGLEDIVKCLLEKGVDPNVRQAWKDPQSQVRPIVDDLWEGPFEFAISNGNEGVVRLLVPYMDSVDYFVGKDNVDETTLTSAVVSGDLNMVRLLVEELKCNVEPTRSQKDGGITTWFGLTPLASAASVGYTHIARYLISNGADVNALIGQEWETALGYAVDGNHVETAKLLIEHGSIADPFIRVKQAKAIFWREADEDSYIEAYTGTIHPLTIAVFGENHEAVKLLFQHIDLERAFECGLGDVSFLLPVAAACGLESIVRRLLKKGCNVNTSTTYCRQPGRVSEGNALSYASKFGHIGVVRILLDHGADPNQRIPFCTIDPLNAAVEAGHQHVVVLLIDAGAEPYVSWDIDIL